MALAEIRKLGDPILLLKAEPVDKEEVKDLMPTILKMGELVLEFRSAYGRGRAITAPQAGLSKRIICLNINGLQPIINPVIETRSDEMIDVWDDCMSFPNLMVRLKRHKRIKLTFRDPDWNLVTWDLEDDMSELIQHEYDHLDGILAVSRAESAADFRWVET